MDAFYISSVYIARKFIAVFLYFVICNVKKTRQYIKKLNTDVFFNCEIIVKSIEQDGSKW